MAERSAPCPPPRYAGSSFTYAERPAIPVNVCAFPQTLPNRQYEQLLRANFVNIRRVRKWKTSTQLHTVVAEHKWRRARLPATYEQLHLSMLAGLLGNVGCKVEAENASGEYLGARGISSTAPRCPTSPKAGALDRGLRAGGNHTPCSGAAWPPSSRSGWRPWVRTC